MPKGTKILDYLREYATLLGLIILIVAYAVLSGKNLSLFNISIIVNQTVAIAVIAVGAIFIYSTGSFDISLGVATVLSGMIGIVIFHQTGSLTLMLLGCILTGIVAGLMTATLSSAFRLPVFITTIGMLSVLSSMVDVVLGGNADISMDRAVSSSLDKMWIRLLIYVIFFVICHYLFNYTKLGRNNKFLGGSRLAASLSGVNPTISMIITFIIVGVGVGLAAIITISRAPTLSKGTASSLGMDVLLAVVFGGMPLAGGARSKISASIIGSFAIVILSQVLIILGVNYGTNQIIKGALFLILVFVSSFSYRGRLLTR